MSNKKKYLMLGLLIIFIVLNLSGFAHALQPTPQPGTGTYSNTGSAAYWSEIGKTLIFGGYTTSISYKDSAYISSSYTTTPMYSTTFEVVTLAGNERIARGSLKVNLATGQVRYWNTQVRISPPNFNPDSTQIGRSLIDNLYRESGIDINDLTSKLMAGGTAWLNPIISARIPGGSGHSEIYAGRLWYHGASNYTYPTRSYSTSDVLNKFNWASTARSQISALFDRSFTIPPIPEVKKAPDTPGAFTVPLGNVTAGNTYTINWGNTSSWGRPTTGSNYRLEVSYNGGSYSLVANTGTTSSRNYTVSSNFSYSTIRFRVRAESDGGVSGWRYSNTVYIMHPVSISASPSSRGWDNTNVSVTVSLTNTTSARYRWTTSTSNPSSGYTNASAGGFSTSQSSDGVWYLQVEASNSLMSDYKCFGPYRIDKTSASHVSHGITEADYVSGNDYWIKPGTTLTIKTSGRDTTSGIRLSYLRLYGGGFDARVNYNWDSGATSPWTGWGVGYDFISGTSSYNSNGYREVTWRVSANPGYSSTAISSVQYYYTDYAGNTVGYGNTGLRLGIDAQAPVISYNADSNEEYKKSHVTTVTASDSGSGVATRHYIWTTTMTTPGWNGGSGWGVFVNGTGINTPPSVSGVYYLHIRAVDNVGNVATQSIGPYRLINVSLEEIEVDDVLFGDGAIDSLPIYAKAGSTVYFHTRYSTDVDDTWAEVDGQNLLLTQQVDGRYRGEFRVPMDAAVGAVYSISVEAEAHGQRFSFHEDEFIIVVGSIWENIRLRFIK